MSDPRRVYGLAGERSLIILKLELDALGWGWREVLFHYEGEEADA